MKGNLHPGWKQAAGAFAIGATAGSAVALLLAPASGRATRKRIAAEFRSLGRSAGQRLNRTKRLLARQAGSVRHVAVEKLDDTRAWLVERLSGNGNGRPHPAPRRIAHHA